MMEMMSDMWNDGWMGRFILICVIVLVAALAWLLWMLIYWACDSWFRTTQVGAAVITGRSHHPAYTTVHMQQCGKTSIPITTYHPESWSVKLQIDDGRSDEVTCSYDEYQAAVTGKPAAVRYKVGRISGAIYVTEALWK